MIIEYKGQTLDTIYYADLTDEECEDIRRDLQRKPSKEDVINNLKRIGNGGVLHNHITKYYFLDLMYDTKLYHSKWSISDVIECNDLIRHFYAKTLNNKKIFPDNHSKAKKIETAFRLAGKGVAGKPSNFPIKTVDYILKNYNVNGNYYDPSCGWGVRLLSALRNNVNYFGTDPNDKLVDRLFQMTLDYKEVNDNDSTVEIRCMGSEVFIPEYVNKMGLAFTSPPYFYLEDYKHGKQSWREGVSYNDWLDNYLTGTIINIHQYLIDDGYAIFNINNFEKFDLVGDTRRIFLENGFEYVETLVLDNIKRPNSNGGHNDNSEGIMVFKKL
jgi:hypothetical protein